MIIFIMFTLLDLFKTFIKLGNAEDNNYVWFVFLSVLFAFHVYSVYLGFQGYKEFKGLVYDQIG